MIWQNKLVRFVTGVHF